MATTVVMPPNNNISLAEKFAPRIDEVYKRGSLSAILDTPSDQVLWTGAKTVQIFNFTPAGLANYSRDGGYVTRNVNAAWEPYSLEIDRGMSAQIDLLDNEETLGLALSATLSETERVEVVPETDAYRFAKYAGTSGVGKASATITADTNVADLVDTAGMEMDEAEVPYEGRILFMSPTAYQGLRKNIERRVINSENNVNTNVFYYNDMQVIVVPQKRFNTAITLNAPTTPEAVGGYTATGKAINFMIVHPSAVMQVIKHRLVRVFNPENNIEADAYRVNFRFYHDCFVKNNKKSGIYVHSAV